MTSENEETVPTNENTHNISMLAQISESGLCDINIDGDLNNLEQVVALLTYLATNEITHAVYKLIQNRVSSEQYLQICQYVQQAVALVQKENDTEIINAGRVFKKSMFMRF